MLGPQADPQATREGHTGPILTDDGCHDLGIMFPTSSVHVRRADDRNLIVGH
jgi:hypothetical protein